MASFFFSSEESAHIDTYVGKRALLRAVKLADAQTPESHAATEPGTRRPEVPPPSRFARSTPMGWAWARQFWQWLWDLDEAQPQPHKSGHGSALTNIQSEFVGALWDLQSLRANHVRDQIESARSLRELWHLRADVFKVIAVHRGQMEAQQRLDALDNHFPLRTSRRAEDSRGKVAVW